MNKNICVFALFFLLTACYENNEKTVTPEVETGVTVEEQQKIIQQHVQPTIPETVETQVIDRQIYPKEVTQYIQLRQNECPKNRQQKAEDLVKSVNLFGDEKPEYILEPDSIHCEDYASVNGNGGSQIAVFATLKDGTTKLVFDHPMFSYEVKQDAQKQELWLDVGGGFCGQDMSQISRSEAISCKRLVEWDEKAQALKLGKMVLNHSQSDELSASEAN